ncbi:TRAP transporter permease [Microbaculum marinisediminis]|uniref:TRAP transporter fused permease subunit n=1 Tax=Microbaculum marinisediminis TaxID=2931392 RepID=A0AAW5R6F1_9HYPH|nr:TRAP transporter fused permease subunit [Microbaculum sp. A6E488]MCT8974209.1 TRAP transporter fused permease subunit [Microbaculum sp. A6E488]
MTDLAETGPADTAKSGAESAVGKALLVLSLLLIAFHVYTAGFGQFQPLVQRSAHVGLGLMIAYLSFGRIGNRADGVFASRFGLVLRLAGAALAGAICIYILSQEQRITESFGIIATPFEIGAAFAIILLILVAAYQTTGPALPILAVLALAYALLGDLIQGSWGHTGFSVSYLVEYLFLGTEGIWGMVTGLSANLIAIFIIFGSVLLATGGAQSFMDIALLVAGRKPGGAAKVATVSSALFGMLNGAAVANVATTGNFTIPAMKRLGYRPSFAGAVEATASSGGQLTPPIMGAGAFVMAELLGIPYLDVVYAAIIPALLFFACVWFSVEIEARREDMKPFDDADMPSWREVLVPARILPLALTLTVTLGAMFAGRTPSLAAFYGIVTNVVLFIVFGGFDLKEQRDRFRALLDGALLAAGSIVSILALLVCAQIVLSLIGLTGVGIKLSESIMGVEASSGLLVGTIFAMIVSLILGMGMPTTAAYLLAAAVVAPALIELGLEPMIAHFFVFYSALLSALTPPVCTAVFAAAVIAKTHWWPICLAAVKLAAMKYILPFFFVFREAVLLKGDPTEIVWAGIMGLVASMLLAIATGRYYLRPIPWPVAAGLFVIGVAVASGNWLADVIAIGALLGLMVVQRLQIARAKVSEDGSPSVRA